MAITVNTVEKGQVWDVGNRGQARIVRRCKNEDHPKSRSFLLEWKGGVRSVWREDSFLSLSPKLVIPAEPKKIPDEFLPRQRWMMADASVAEIGHVEWDKERGDYEIMLNPDGDADIITLLGKVLREKAVLQVPRAHDFSNPYLMIRGRIHCTACGNSIAKPDDIVANICVPDSDWRARFEARLSREQQWYADAMARARKTPRVEPQPGFSQSHNLSAGIGIFSLRDETPKRPVGLPIPEPAKLTEDEYPF